MRIRGERECKSCGTRWTYYETGSVECPDCGSPVSVGVGDRVEHTADPIEFDLTPVRASTDEAPREEVADVAAATAREFCRRSGFVDAGDLLPLTDTYLAAAELREVAGTVARGFPLDEEAELYFLALLRGADSGERPAVDEVPEAFRDERGRAVARAVEAYRRDLQTVLEEPAREASRTLSTIRAHRKRLDALDGDIPPRETEGLLEAVRDLGRYVREEDEGALARSGERLERL